VRVRARAIERSHLARDPFVRAARNDRELLPRSLRCLPQRPCPVDVDQARARLGE
jgi:hypothetical protein